MDKPTPTRFTEGFVTPNRHILRRLESMVSLLFEAYQGGDSLSSATKGAERELFVESVLREVFPPHFRFGSGDITDSEENRSGQIDIVIEYPNLYSFPVWQSSPRLYLAEGVAVAIEVKSNLANQWSEVESTCEKLKQLTRRYGPTRMCELADRYEALGDPDSAFKAHDLRMRAAAMEAPKERIPLYVVGYEGWAKPETLQKHIDESEVDVAIQLDRGFVGINGVEPFEENLGAFSMMLFLEFIAGNLKQDPPQSTMFHYATQSTTPKHPSEGAG